jgi:hypothetical protein
MSESGKAVFLSYASQDTDAATRICEEVPVVLKLIPGTWCRDGETAVACFALPKGISRLQVA